MFASLRATALLALLSSSYAALVPRQQGVHLAVNPQCGTYPADGPTDFNAGIGPLSSFETIVAFGDDYTFGGASDGGDLPPPTVVHPNPRAGGRLSNGPVWVEYLASKAGATLRDYAAEGAIIDRNMWTPSEGLGNRSDFTDQAGRFIVTGGRPNPDTTLYVIFLGINDYDHAIESGATTLLHQPGGVIYNALRLLSAPTFGRNFVFVDNYGRGNRTPLGEAYKAEVFDGIQAMRRLYGANVAFADLSTIWDGVLGDSPGHAAFGYTNTGTCTVDETTTVGACSDPDHSFYWIPGTPSTATHSIIADYVEQDKMSDNRPPITPNPERWRPNSDPSSIEIPGLDTSAPANDQIQQIEQLITIKLQKIDENFAKIHDVLANRLLPAVKRYSVGTVPVRESAKFWTSFYEQAAQIRIPTYDDFSGANQTPSAHDETMTQETEIPESQQSPIKSPQYEPSIITSESSFMPAQGAISSTPAHARMAYAGASFTSDSSQDPSWRATIESPLVRLDREIKDLTRGEDVIDQSQIMNGQPSSYSLAEPTPRVHRPAVDKGKGKEPLLRHVLQREGYNPQDVSNSSFSSCNSPMRPKAKAKTPIPRKLNPYLPHGKDPDKWDGVIDLNEHSLTPRGIRQSRQTPSSTDEPTTPTESNDDSDNDLPPGMSPLVTVSPVRLSKPKAETSSLHLGRTPMKEASARITKDLIKDFQRQNPASRSSSHISTTDSSMSTMHSAPSLSKYQDESVDSSVVDASLSSMMRHVGLDVSPPPAKRPPPPLPPTVGSTPGLRLRRRSIPAKASPRPSAAASAPIFTAPSKVLSFEDEYYDEDSLDEVNNTAHPSAAFIMASLSSADDSFGSNNSGDSDDAGEGFGVFAPGAMQEDHFEDDSFDDDNFNQEVEEETIFGAPPAQRQALFMQQQRAQGGQWRMMGEELLEDTIGIGSQMARTGRVEETPTPAWGGQR
ncbi:hypothetical protein AX16_008596 [Volvariella volvacea WC 439]|nr:hypothetical protein AX16_008596 [Volvariella volvacea WC 439]